MSPINRISARRHPQLSLLRSVPRRRFAERTQDHHHRSLQNLIALVRDIATSYCPVLWRDLPLPSNHAALPVRRFLRRNLLSRRGRTCEVLCRIAGWDSWRVLERARTTAPLSVPDLIRL